VKTWRCVSTYIVLCQDGWRGDKERKSDNSKWLEAGKHYDWMDERKAKKENIKMSISEGQEKCRIGGCGREIYELEWEVKETKGKKMPVWKREKIGTFRGGRRMASFPHRSRNSILHYEITQTLCAHGHWRRRAYASSRRIVINFVFVQSFQEFKLEKLYCDTCSRTRVSLWAKFRIPLKAVSGGCEIEVSTTWARNLRNEKAF